MSLHWDDVILFFVKQSMHCQHALKMIDFLGTCSKTDFSGEYEWTVSIGVEECRGNAAPHFYFSARIVKISFEKLRHQSKLVFFLFFVIFLK